MNFGDICQGVEKLERETCHSALNSSNFLVTGATNPILICFYGANL
jgi:hypothetical protein